MAAATEFCRLTVRDDGIAVLYLSRPAFLNALHLRAVRALTASVKLAADNPAVRVLLLAGDGRGFCSGADLAGGEDGLAGKPTEASVAQNMDEVWNPLIRAIHEFPKPTMTVAHGAVAGGGVGLALATDVTIAARSAFFVLGFTPTLGICPDLGSTWQIARRLGRGRALPLALFGTRLYAEEAQRCDLIWEAVDDDRLWARAFEWAAKLAELPPLAVRLVRSAVDAGSRLDLPSQLDLERDAQKVLLLHPDSQRLMKARVQHFKEAAEKRKSKL